MTIDVTAVTMEQLATSIANLSIQQANGVAVNMMLNEQLEEANAEIARLKELLGEDYLEDEPQNIDGIDEVVLDAEGDEVPAPAAPAPKAAPKKGAGNGQPKRRS